MTTKKSNKRMGLTSKAMTTMENMIGGPLTLGDMLLAIREGEGWSQEELGSRLDVSRGHICDIEKGRRSISPGRAARWARILGYSESQMVRLALQAQVDAATLELRVEVVAA